MFRKIFAFIAGAAILAVGTLVPLGAYDLTPIVVQLRPSGAASAQQMTITNSHEQPIAIEVKAYKREQLADGTDRLVLETQDILITPPQMVIAPKSSQTFKVRWVGDPSPERELAYRIVTTQLPIKFKSRKTGDTTANVSLAYRYEAALYVTPPGKVPDASLAQIQETTDSSGQTWLELSIKNDGSARALIDKPTLLLHSAGGSSVTLTGAQLAELQNLNVLAGSERKVRLPWPDNLPRGPVTGELQKTYTILK
ncbi:molecular chaperone [Sphingopyxis sp. JAI128]|uniref:fimbrial biogenesis chaperone n=1 Tax=Sphingopyxis sp. JAI128 TaxID=2723066 RepID=UPI001610B947|nr:fimbria/pilus periplasmic chaperone [Sphingopyxis sp. JAI128]MBB6427478.1 fimbrial chaperone protein [Sphingopyxis sp. JAI128]